MELKIGRAIVRHGAEELYEYSDVDVAIVGAGPSGLTAARYLAEKGLKVIVLERRFSFGGGIGPGGNMFPKIIVQEEAPPYCATSRSGTSQPATGCTLWIPPSS
jgi:Flavoprotein involved in thiazole biosynthesis